MRVIPKKDNIHWLIKGNLIKRGDLVGHINIIGNKYQVIDRYATQIVITESIDYAKKTLRLYHTFLKRKGEL